MNVRSLALTLAAAATFVAPGAAFAADTNVRSTGVRFSDLNLGSDAGQKELQRRLDHAAREVCGMNETATGSRLSTRESRECYRDARKTLGEQLSRAVKNSAVG